MIKKVIQITANLSRLMSNIGGFKEDKKRLLVSVVHSRIIEEVIVSAEMHSIQNGINKWGADLAQYTTGSTFYHKILRSCTSHAKKEHI